MIDRYNIGCLWQLMVLECVCMRLFYLYVLYVSHQSTLIYRFGVCVCIFGTIASPLFLDERSFLRYGYMTKKCVQVDPLPVQRV